MMQEVLELNDGTREIVSGVDDLLWVVENYIGTDARRLLVEFLSEDSEATEVMKENDDLYEALAKKEEHYQKVLERIYAAQAKLTDEIVRPELDRTRISNIAGEIAVTTREAMR